MSGGCLARADFGRTSLLFTCENLALTGVDGSNLELESDLLLFFLLKATILPVSDGDGAANSSFDIFK